MRHLMGLPTPWHRRLIRCCHRLSAVFLFVLGACSGRRSSDQPEVTVRTTSSTTSPRESSASPDEVRQFFQTTGADLLAFERATAPIMNGERPPRSACEQAWNVVGPLVADASRFDGLLQGVPDSELRAALVRDAQSKVFLLRACLSPTGLHDSPGALRTYAEYRERSRGALAILARFGVRV